MLVNFTDQGLKGGTCSGNEEDQLRLDLTREMCAQRGFDHTEDLGRRRIAVGRNGTANQV